jgi:hypothetical protein
MIRKSGNRFSEKIMLHQKDRAPNRFNLKPSRFNACRARACPDLIRDGKRFAEEGTRKAS